MDSKNVEKNGVSELEIADSSVLCNDNEQSNDSLLKKRKIGQTHKITKKRKVSNKTEDDDDDKESESCGGTISDEDEEDDDDEDDSIVVPDDEVDVEKSELSDEELDTEAEKVKRLKEEAERFIGTLPAKRQRKPVVDNMIPIIHEVFQKDEIRELINEIKIWKRTLQSKAVEKNISWPSLNVSMPYDFVKEKHDEIRKMLDLESSDDEEDEDDIEEEDDEEDSSYDEENSEEEDDDDDEEEESEEEYSEEDSTEEDE